MKKFINGQSQDLPLQKKKGFTLVELIIVISILAILATIAFMSFQDYTKSARDSNRVATINSIQKGLELFVLKTGSYPLPDGNLSTGILNTIPLTFVGNIGENISRLLNINTTPVDPASKTSYTYGISVDKNYYQIATTLENLQSSTIISITYANSYQAKVIGNYKGLLSVNGKIYNLPSLIFTGSGEELTSNNTFFVADKGQNLPYKINNDTPNNTQITSEVMKLLTGTGVSLTGMTIPTNTTQWNTNSGSLEQYLGYKIDTLGIHIYGDAYLVDKDNLYQSSINPTCSDGMQNGTETGIDCGGSCGACAPVAGPYVSGTPYVKGDSFTFDGLTWYVSANTKVAYTKTSGINNFPNNLTDADHIFVFDNGQTLTKGTNAFIIRTVNQGATQVYNYGTAYASGRLWNEGATTNYGSITATRQASYTADKAMLGDYYQWGRNDSVSLTGTTTILYGGLYQTGGINYPTNFGFVINSTTPYSWMMSGTHLISSGVIWTDTSNSGPCPSNYHIPTSGNGTKEWGKVTELVTGLASGWGATQIQNLQKYLLLPMAGSRDFSAGVFSGQGSNGNYWSSSVSGGNGHNVLFLSTGVDPSFSNYRANGFSVRCFQN